ncbi:hypothetical protein N7475_000598 [Penicillium sp. IBT 31633x]|nr:hypothetical protein N7475_000598 [Penicillium sp. IBT 31633x]
MARPYGPRRDCRTSRLMLGPSHRIYQVMHVRLRSLAIQTSCHPGFSTKVAKKQVGHRRSTRDMQGPLLQV